VALDLRLRPDRPPGPRYVEGDFLSFADDGRFDAILFTSSLHHLHDLDAAVARAHALLAPGGVVAVDDFDLEAPDEATARWLYLQLSEPAGAAALARWRDGHAHDPPLHGALALDAALRRRFRITAFSTGPYLYRYGGERAGALLALELEALARRAIVPVGRRWLAQR
jgi:SAM-dependent methyltransferase